MAIQYFAYGSNMLPARLQKRCGSAQVRGTAKALGYCLDFSKVSKDRSGKATIFELEGAVTPGVLFEVSDSEIGDLDKAEGVGSGYFRTNQLLVSFDGSGDCLRAVSYIADRRDLGLQPYDWYLALVIAGAMHHSLDGEHLTCLRSFSFIEDDCLDRDSRMEAIAIFEAQNIHDYRKLIEQRG